MALFGKILLFFNVLAAGALAYFATQDWAKRQSLTATALQYHLVVKGLPLETPKVEPDANEKPDEVLLPLRVETTGGYQTEYVRTSFLKAHFAGADGGATFGGATKPVTSQFDELKRVEDKAAGILTGLDEAKRLAQLCGSYNGDPATARPKFTPGWLHTLAESYEEREAIRRLARSGPEQLGDALKTAEVMFKQKFDTATAKPNTKFSAEEAEKLPAKIKDALDKFKAKPDDKAVQEEFYKTLTDRPNTAPRDDADQKRQIAHLLTLLDPTPEWQKRVALVVGLKQHVGAISEQATRLDQMTRTAQRLIEVDQAKFVEEYEQLKQFALDRSVILDAQKALRINLYEQKTKDEEAVKVRQKQLDDRKTVLAEIKAEVAAKLTAQAEVEKKLFEVQQRVGDTLVRNFELEADLDKEETKKLRGGGK